MRASVYLPTGRPAGTARRYRPRGPRPGPGRDRLARRDRARRGANASSKADLRVDPRGRRSHGGIRRSVGRGVAVVNTAYHAQRTLRYASTLLERALPPWSCGSACTGRNAAGEAGITVSTRVPTVSCRRPTPYARRARCTWATAAGRSLRRHPAPSTPRATTTRSSSTRSAPLCRHTADFRLNRLRPADAQVNGRSPWTGDVRLPRGRHDRDPRHLRLAPRARPGLATTPQEARSSVDDGALRRRVARDPHTDGTVWGSALSSARAAVAAAGNLRSGSTPGVSRPRRARPRAPSVRSHEALLRRRSVSDLLASILDADPCWRVRWPARWRATASCPASTTASCATPRAGSTSASGPRDPGAGLVGQLWSFRSFWRPQLPTLGLGSRCAAASCWSTWPSPGRWPSSSIRCSGGGRATRRWRRSCSGGCPE